MSYTDQKRKTCPRCNGSGNENGCIGEGLCLLCLGKKKVLIDERKN